MSTMEFDTPRREVVTISDDRGIPELRVLVTTTSNGYCDADRSGRPWENWSYSVTITVAGRKMHTPYSVGVGWTSPPTSVQILASVVDDYYTGQEQATFDEFCDDFGYDTDSRDAYATWLALREHVKKVERVLGEMIGTLSAHLDDGTGDEHVEVKAR